jgi:hypothetical protein
MAICGRKFKFLVATTCLLIVLVRDGFTHDQLEDS